MKLSAHWLSEDVLLYGFPTAQEESWEFFFCFLIALTGAILTWS